MYKKIIISSLVTLALVIMTGCTSENNATSAKCGEGKCDTAKQIEQKCEAGKCAPGKCGE